MFNNLQKNNPILIAELCQNHCGSITLMREMVHAASEAGVKYIKIQDIHSNELIKRARFDNKKNSSLFRPFLDEYKRLKKLDLPKNFVSIFVNECYKRKCKPIITPFTHKSYDRIKNKKLSAIKIASYDSTSISLLNRLKELNLPFIISTGATTNSQIEKTAKIMRGFQYAFLHCVTVYPTPLHLCNLLKIKFLKKFTPNVGWSDHTKFEENSHVASLAAVLSGAKIIERHFTILDRSKTKDGVVSINEKDAKEFLKISKLKNSEIKNYLKDLNKNWKATYNFKSNRLSKIERLNLDYYRGRFATKYKNKIVYNWKNFNN